MNIYVGNLSFDTSEENLRQAFEAHGEVSSVNIITDKYSGKSRGFGFVEMSDDSTAQNTIEAMNGQDIDGRTIVVSEAKPRQDRGDRGDRGNRGGGGGYRDNNRRNRY